MEILHRTIKDNPKIYRKVKKPKYPKYTVKSLILNYIIYLV